MLSKGSNLLKYQNVTLNEDDARIIDYNDRIAEKIAELSQNLQEEMKNDNPEEFADGFSDGLNAEQVSALLDDDSGNVIKAEPVYDGPSPEELIEQAREQADAILRDAGAQAEELKQNAYNEGSMQGYQDGANRAEQEIADKENELSMQYAQKEQQLTEVYRQKLDEIEPALIDTLTNIYEHIFDVELSGYRDVIVHLIGNALRKTENSQEYLIHVSPEELPFVSMNKDKIMEEGGLVNCNVEFIEDMTLKKNQCLIETDGGIFDCSLGVELKELKKQLLLLSYDGAQRG